MIGRGAWDRLYASKYGSALDFLRAHPEAFYLGGDSGNLFYRPEAPARLPQPSAWPAPPPAASMPAHPLPVPGGPPTQSSPKSVRAYVHASRSLMHCRSGRAPWLASEVAAALDHSCAVSLERVC